MYVSIDRENMALVHKHEDQSTVSKLASIELPHVACIVLSVSGDCFSIAFTDLELQKLHQTITGQLLPGYSRGHLVSVCTELVARAAVTDCDRLEVDLQYRSIPDNDSARYAYVKGSMKPLLMPDLWQPSWVVVPRLTAEALLAIEPYKASAAARNFAAAPIPAPAQGSRPPAPAAPRAAPVAPRGGQRTVIWDAADKAWEAAGKPTNASIILKMRKEVMDGLEKQGVKRTSCSSELGNWQKARCG